MENLLRHIRRRCLTVGGLSAAMLLSAIGLLIGDSVPEEPPSWYIAACVVCCLGSMTVLALSGWQLRQARRDQADDTGLLKKAEKNCWEAVMTCVICGVWAVLDLLFFDSVHAGTPAGVCQGMIIWNSFCIAGTLSKVLPPQTDAEPTE